MLPSDDRLRRRHPPPADSPSHSWYTLRPKCFANGHGEPNRPSESFPLMIRTRGKPRSETDDFPDVSPGSLSPSWSAWPSSACTLCWSLTTIAGPPRTCHGKNAYHHYTANTVCENSHSPNTISIYHIQRVGTESIFGCRNTSAVGLVKVR